MHSRTRHFSTTFLAACIFASTGVASSPGARGILWSVDWHPKDTSIAVAGQWLHVIETKSFTSRSLPALDALKSSRSVRFDPKGHLLAVSGGQEEPTYLYDFISEHSRTLDVSARGVAWDRKGEKLATANDDGSLQIWSRDGSLLHTSKPKNGKSLTGVAWNPSGEKIVTTGEFIRVHDSTGKMIKQLSPRPTKTGTVLMLCVEWHPSGDFFVIGDYGDKEAGVAPAIQFWSANGDLLKTLEIASEAAVRNVRWSRDGQRLASASDALRIWSVDGGLLHTGQSSDFLWGVAWNSADSQLVTTSQEGRVTLWDSTAQRLRDLVEPAPLP